MGKRIVHLSAALAVLLYAAPLLAVEPAPESLLTGVKWLKAEIVGGRLAFRGERCTQNRYQAECGETDSHHETLSIRMMPQHLQLRYERCDGEARLFAEGDDRGQIMLSRTPGPSTDADLREIRYLQPPCGKVTLTLVGDKTRMISADDLWQLMLAERDLCREHLLPLLSIVRDDWELDAQLDALERLLVARCQADVLGQHAQWHAWVDELTSPQFAKRQAADLALRECGQPVLAFLRQSLARQGTGQLDAEQRRRVLAILNDLPDGRADCPSRVADWLAADRRVWLALLSRGDLEQRIAAAEHLSKLCQRPVVFNPTASLPERDAQVAALAALLGDH